MCLILLLLVALGFVISAAMAQTVPYQQNAMVTNVFTNQPVAPVPSHNLPAPPSTETLNSWISNINGWYAAALIIWTYLSHKFRDILATIRKAWPGIKAAYTAIAAHGGLSGIFHTLMFGIKNTPPNPNAGQIPPPKSP
jgi:hypothetical protein